MELFLEYIEGLENTGIIEIEKPASMPAEEDADRRYLVYLTSVELKKILAAKAAHSVWLDKNDKVPWKLSNYNSEELLTLFDKNTLFNFDAYQQSFYFSVVDYSPSDAYQYAKKFIKDNMKETVYSIIDDSRSDFIHFVKDDGEPSAPSSLIDALNYRIDSDNEYMNGKRISRLGCHSMSRILIGQLRSINIPAYETRGFYEGKSHSSGVFIGGEVGFLNHGDDIYTRTLTAAPTDKLLMELDYFNKKVKPCGEYTECAKKETMRFTALQSIKYISDSTINACCDIKYGYDSCEDFFDRNKISEYLSDAELKNALNEIEELCELRYSPPNDDRIIKEMSVEEFKIYEYNEEEDVLPSEEENVSPQVENNEENKNQVDEIVDKEKKQDETPHFLTNLINWFNKLFSKSA